MIIYKKNINNQVKKFKTQIYSFYLQKQLQIKYFM